MIRVELLFLLVFDSLRAYNHLAHNLGHDGLSLVGSLLYLLVRYLNGDVEATQVGNHRDTEGADATVVSHDNLRHGTHAYGVTTQDAIHLIFGRRLECGTLNAHIDTILQADLLLACNLTGQLNERLVVSLVHIREAGTRGEILATQRMLREEVDVVGDNHQVANLETRVHATGSVADEECLDADFVHHTDGESHFLH